MEKLYENIKKELKEIEQNGISASNIDTASKLIKMMKELCEIKEKEGKHMKDYSNYRSHIQNDMITYSGNFHFQQQLKQEGSHVTVNFEKYFNKDIKDKYFMIIRNSTNENKENLEERTIMAYKKYNLKTPEEILV